MRGVWVVQAESGRFRSGPLDRGRPCPVWLTVIGCTQRVTASNLLWRLDPRRQASTGLPVRIRGGRGRRHGMARRNSPNPVTSDTRTFALSDICPHAAMPEWRSTIGGRAIKYLCQAWSVLCVIDSW